MGRTDEEGEIVVIFAPSGANGLDGRHPERGEENSERLHESHSSQETGPRCFGVSPSRAIWVATATQCENRAPGAC
jgi:hypothetical protein